MESASRAAQSILKRWQSFSVELSEVKVFPETNILYLDIGRGSGTLHELHDELNTGELAYDENFDFLPHLTISGPISKRRLAKVHQEAKRTWEEQRGVAEFEVKEVVALWQPPHGSPDDWNRVWSEKLRENGRSAQAGSR